MKVFEYTNQGCREENQDYIVSGSLPDDSGIYIVVDGMGGYSDGATASKVVGDAIFDFIQKNHIQYAPTTLIKEAIFYANDALMLKRISLTVQKMGCVVAVLMVVKNFAYLTWLGDSRIYLFRNEKEVYRTEDHSALNELSKNNNLQFSDYNKFASIVTNAIMGDDTIDFIPIRRIEIEKGDVFILCTDGLHKEIDVLNLLCYNDSHKKELDAIATNISDNFSFIKVEISN